MSLFDVELATREITKSRQEVKELRSQISKLQTDIKDISSLFALALSKLGGSLEVTDNDLIIDKKWTINRVKNITGGFTFSVIFHDNNSLGNSLGKLS